MHDPTYTDPQKNIRSDLWSEMSLSELINQQDLVITRTSLLLSMPLTESIQSIRMALQSAQDALTKLIEQKTQQGM